MTPELTLDLIRDAFQVALMLSLPVMLATLIVGVAVSIFQSITSIQEQTMTFVPKILAVVLTVIVAFPWMMNKVLDYTTELFESIPGIVK